MCVLAELNDLPIAQCILVRALLHPTVPSNHVSSTSFIINVEFAFSGIEVTHLLIDTSDKHGYQAVRRHIAACWSKKPGFESSLVAQNKMLAMVNHNGWFLHQRNFSNIKPGDTLVVTADLVDQMVDELYQQCLAIVVCPACPTCPTCPTCRASLARLRFIIRVKSFMVCLIFNSATLFWRTYGLTVRLVWFNLAQSGELGLHISCFAGICAVFQILDPALRCVARQAARQRTGKLSCSTEHHWCSELLPSV